MSARKLIASAALAASLATSIVAVGSTPATAATVCTSISTTAVGIITSGAIRKSAGLNTKWSFVEGNGCFNSFPVGGQVWLEAGDLVVVGR